MGGGAGNPSPLPAAPALCAPCQQPGNATATRGSLARAGVPRECSFGVREAEPARESHAAGVRFPTAPWCPCVSNQARLAGALDLRLPVSQGKPLQGQGPVRIRAVPVPAQPQPAASRSAAERNGVPPCQAVPAYHKRGCEGICVLLLGRHIPSWKWKRSAGEEPGAQTSMGAPVLSVHRAGVRAFLEVPGRSRWDVQALHHQNNWQPHEGRTQMPRGCRVCPVPATHTGRAGRAVPAATADGGRQLRSVTSLADPVSSISSQVLKSPWKPAWQQPRQHPHSQRPAGATPVASGKRLVASGR